MKWIHKAAVAAGLVACAAIANAEDFPTGPVRIVSAYPPAGGVDIAARIIAPSLQARLGQTVIIENKAGAAGTVGTAYVSRAKADVPAEAREAEAAEG